MKKAILTFLILDVFLIHACRQMNQESGISGGTIEYSIHYLNNDLSGNMEELLPKNMELVFDQEKAVNYIDGFLGMYRLNTVTDFTTRRCSTLLKVFDKNYLYAGRKGEFMCCFDSMDDMEIVETGETRVIAGLMCKRAIASFPLRNESFDIFYTQEIGPPHPNLNNPYKKVDGVLVQFEMQLFHLRMKFSAEKFISQSGRQSRMTVPVSTTEITRDQMAQILLKLLE